MSLREIYLENSVIKISPLELTNLRYTNACRNECRDFLHDCKMYSYQECMDWFNKLPSTSKRFAVWSTEDKEGMKIIKYAGTCRVDNIDYANRTCYAGVDLYRIFRGYGIGYVAWKLLLDELFGSYGMERVRLEVLNFNGVALKLYNKLGFSIEGILKDRVIRRGEKIDSTVMSLSIQDWESIE